jgi:hypothetical protein
VLPQDSLAVLRVSHEYSPQFAAKQHEESDLLIEQRRRAGRTSQ